MNLISPNHLALCLLCVHTQFVCGLGSQRALPKDFSLSSPQLCRSGLCRHTGFHECSRNFPTALYLDMHGLGAGHGAGSEHPQVHQGPMAHGPLWPPGLALWFSTLLGITRMAEPREHFHLTKTGSPASSWLPCTHWTHQASGGLFPSPHAPPLLWQLKHLELPKTCKTSQPQRLNSWKNSSTLPSQLSKGCN